MRKVSLILCAFCIFSLLPLRETYYANKLIIQQEFSFHSLPTTFQMTLTPDLILLQN